MSLTATFDAPNSRVLLHGAALPILPGMNIMFERSDPASGWEGVRGAFPAAVIAATFDVDDYEFTPNVLNSYRIRTDFINDTFTRAVSPGWGNANASGQLWTHNAVGTAANWTVAGNQGRYTMADGTTVVGGQNLLTTSVLNFDYYADVSLSQTPTGGTITGQINGRGGGTSSTALNYDWVPSGALNISLIGNNGATILATLNTVIGSAINVPIHIRFQANGLTLRAKAWVGDPILDEPAIWTITAQDIVPPVTGTIGVKGVRNAANTNVNPIMAWDNLHVADLATTSTQYFMLGTATVTPAQTTAWLKFPLRPFLNRPITLCNWGDEERPARGQIFEVLGRRLPVAVTEVRGSRRFPVIIKAVDSDEEDLLALSMSFGDVIFLQTPGPSLICGLNMRVYPEQGYFYANDMNSSRPIDGVTTWVLTLGLQEVAPPDYSVGGANSTWQGIINAFATWQDVINAFATWTDVLNFISDPLDEIVG